MTIATGDWVGQRIGRKRYSVLALLGQGGMGFVYRAVDNNLQTEVVIKTPRRAMLDVPGFVERFTREIRSLVALQNPSG